MGPERCADRVLSVAAGLGRRRAGAPWPERDLLLRTKPLRWAATVRVLRALGEESTRHAYRGEESSSSARGLSAALRLTARPRAGTRLARPPQALAKG